MTRKYLRKERRAIFFRCPKCNRSQSIEAVEGSKPIRILCCKCCKTSITVEIGDRFQLRSVH